MCGIAGIVSPYRLDDGATWRALQMRDVASHRGPDDAGVYSDARAILVHRRLSIIDLEGGRQPLSNEDGTIWTVFNGEIYNHRDLRSELEGLGHQYRSRSDTETIVHAYEEWGIGCAHLLRGMFAFAIWDARRQCLYLVRDRLGVKPLYWYRAGDRFLFGSEIKSLLASGLVRLEANVAVIPEVLSTRYTSSDETLFRGVHKLLPGHVLEFAGGELSTMEYWDVPCNEHVHAGRARPDHPGVSDQSDTVARFRELLEESVRLRLMADVPLGMFLSGGLDSSAIAAIMARQIDRPLQTFSVAFKERAFSELDYARDVARAIGAESHEIVIDDRDFFTALPKLIWHEDEPLAHPSSVPLYFVSALARQHVKVVLTGEGSDELLAGYGKYPRVAWNWRAGGVYERMVPRTARRVIERALVDRLPLQLGRYARRSFLSMDRSLESMFLDNFAAIRVADQQRLLAPGLREKATYAAAYGASLKYFDAWEALTHGAPARSSIAPWATARSSSAPGAPDGGGTLLDRLLYTDLKTYLVELLMKQDQMSMAASIESRVPFLDHRLVEFAATLPDTWKLSGRTTKRILREAVKNLLPATILTRPKMGFPVPFAEWTRGASNAIVREVLLDRRSRERGIIDAAAVDALLRDHASGRTDGGDRLWSLVNLELWYRTFIDREGVQTLPHAYSVAQVGPAAAA